MTSSMPRSHCSLKPPSWRPSGRVRKRSLKWLAARDADRVNTFHGCETKLGPEHPHTTNSLNELVHLYEPWGKPVEAARWRAKLAERNAARE